MDLHDTKHKDGNLKIVVEHLKCDRLREAVGNNLLNEGTWKESLDASSFLIQKQFWVAACDKSEYTSGILYSDSIRSVGGQ